jgi:hypothetical protein
MIKPSTIKMYPKRARVTRPSTKALKFQPWRAELRDADLWVSK